MKIPAPARGVMLFGGTRIHFWKNMALLGTSLGAGAFPCQSVKVDACGSPPLQGGANLADT